MVHAGANIEAFLKLDATGFKTGLKGSEEAVRNFKKAVIDVNTEVTKSSEKTLKTVEKFSKSLKEIGDPTVELGFRNLSKALNALIQNLNRFDEIQTASVNRFKTFASGMENLATAAQRLSASMRNGGQGIEALNTIVEVFEVGMSNAQATIKLTASQLQTLNREANNTRTTTRGLSEEEKVLQTQFNLLERTMQHTSMRSEEVRAVARRLREEYNVTGVKLREMIDLYFRSATATKQYATALVQPSRSMSELQTKVNLAKTSLVDFDKVMQSFSTKINPTRMSLVNLSTVFEEFRVLKLNPTKMSMDEVTASLMKNSQAMQENAVATLRAMGYTGKLSVEEEKLATTTNQASSSLTRQSSSATNSASSMDRASTSANRLSKALSSLRMIGTMVASMMVWNFASSLVNATRETVNSKSEMEGYFKMLHFGQDEIDGFNDALDRTVQRFQRVNKYSLGETISSIGVEFGLTTKEMEKAMTVTSMITSEYLRAGRNANEASLAVKDVLQGQFQRLSRETGVKQQNLIDAGWSGDTNDVLGLMEALEEVGRSRHWEVFAEKANSLNDIVTILQNRFGEWSADMVNVVQPTILNVFNSMLSFAEGLEPSLSHLWEWLNGGSWEANATQVGIFTSAILVLSQALLQFRSGLGLVEASQLGFTKSIASVVLGLKGEEIANKGVLNTIKAKILGVNADAIAERGLSSAIKEKTVMSKMDTIQNKLNTLSSEENTVAKKFNAIEEAILKAQKEGLITTTEAETLQTELNTASKELNSIVTSEQIGANTGLIASLYWLGTGEAIVTGETTALSIAMGVLNGIIALSPVGWLAVGVLALASAFYVLTGGLDESYATMKRFNEVVTDSRTTIQPYKDELERTREEYGYYSEEAQEAQEALDNVTHSVEHGVYWAKKYNEEFEGIDAKLDNITRKQLGDLGYSDEEIDQVSELHKVMYDGADRDYKALQVLHKQQADYTKGVDELGDKFKKMGIEGEDANTVLEKYEGNTANLLKHSAIANTSDDWWEASWNKLYAGMDQFWIDWDNFWLDPQWSDAIDGLFHLLDARFGITEILKAIGIDISDQSVGDMITGFFNNIGQWFEGKTLMDIFGLDPNYDYFGEWLKSISSTASSSISWLFNDVINPTVWNAIMSIPIVSDIINLFMLISNDNIGAEEKGRAIGNWIGNGLITAIGQIPIVGDILRMLGLIPSTYGDANSKGKGVGDNVDSGVKGSAMATLSNWVVQEFVDAINGIGKLGQQAYDTAKGWADQLWNGVNSVLQRHSPGFFHDEIKAEFGTDIPNAISSSSDTAYTVAQSYAQSMYEGMSSASNTGFGLGGVVDDYKSDAQIVANSSEMMGSETTLAFNQMQLAVNDSTTQMQGNVATSYGAMQQKQSTLLNNMKSSNTTAYNEMTTKSNQSLMQMRDSTSNITTQMTSAWMHMKDQIVATANKLKTDATTHFNTLSSNIGSFYRKIQNPSNWGSAGSSSLRQGARRPSVGRRASSILKPSGYGGGSKWTGSTTMTIGALKSKLCQNGDCSIFDGYNPTDVVNVQEFLGMVGQGHGFGWNNWDSTHYNHIKTTSDQWNMKSPQLLGYIDTNADFKVGDFNSGQPKISFASFQSMAESLFSAIPYKFYYDSSWKGSWLGAIQSGACNCYDGASALIAFANTCGFDGYMAHGSWNGIPHVWAVINGKKMDTTGWQQRGTWTPSASAGGYSSARMKSYGGFDGGKTVNITIDMSNSNIYGMDDFKNQIREASKEVIREEFNDPYTVPI